MRKSSIFISATLTTFALVMLYGVVYAYHGLTAATSTTQAVATPTDIPASATSQTVTPEEAAQIAAQVLGRNDLLSAESANLNGVDAYKITFQSGDAVYVGLDGQILSIQTVPQVVLVPAQSTTNQKSTNKKPSTTNHTSGGHDNEGGD